MNAIIFGLIFSAVFVLLNFYIHKRFILKLDASKKTKHYLNIFLLLNFLGLLGYILARYYVNIPNWLYFLLSLPIGVIFLLFCTAFIYDISRVTLSYIPLSRSRRNFFKRSLDISSLLAASAMSAKAMQEAKVVKLENMDVKIKKLKRAYNIVQISDIHIAGLINAEFIENIVKRVNRLDPDIVVITGDLIDIDVSSADKALSELKNFRTKYGTFFIVGNHEYFHGITNIINKVKSLGIKVLENENVYIGERSKGFNLAGVYDLFGYRIGAYKPDLNKALNGIDKDSPTILLAHQPKFIKEVKNGVDLMLSGHTHGGQIYPFRFLVQLQQPYIEGLHKHNEELQIYVNKGTGFWGPPMRLGASSEITLIRIS